MRNHHWLRFVKTALRFVLWSSVQAIVVAQNANLPQQIETKYCYRLPDDDIADVTRNRYLAELRAAGEHARLALLGAAQSKSRIQTCALDYLVDLREPRAIPLLRKQLRSGGNAEQDVRQAVHGLARLNDAESMDAIVRLISPSNQPLTESVLGALGSLDHPEARARLRIAAGDPTLGGSSATIAAAIGRQRDPEAVPVLRGLGVRAIENKDSLTVANAVVALVSIRTPGSTAEAKAIWQSFPDKAWKVPIVGYAVEALMRQRDAAKDKAEENQIDILIHEVEAWRKGLAP
jgi:hypothetical protein